MTKSAGIVSALYKCDDCGASFECHKNAQALAAQHAKKYKHVVRGETTLVVTYDGK